ncbi:MAG: STAS domain-containing protein [Lachnospiraceae bacterium]|nr:STAS domain-containing protein [Lachnospiraceae bacterium]
MTINENKNGSELVIIPEGRLDTTTAPELETRVKEIIEGVTDLTFDLSKLEYISSAGLRVLLSTQKVMEKQGKMRFINVSDIIMEIFDVTGFSEILTIE